MHVVARARAGYKPFADPAAAWWLLGRLRIVFAKSLAACLMPDHVHLITTGTDPNRTRVRLARVLATLAFRLGVPRLFDVPLPEAINNGKHLERQVRYVHLNPCRAKLTRDPLSWPWSTHRGLVGAEVDPWVTPESLAAALGRSVRGFGHWLHAYVSGDPSVDTAGSAPPAPCKPSELPGAPLDFIRRAALGATPWSTPWLRRKLLVELALHQGWRDSELIARAVGVTGRSVRRLMVGPHDPVTGRAGQLCLGDSRLLLPEELIRPLGPLPR